MWKQMHFNTVIICVPHIIRIAMTTISDCIERILRLISAWYLLCAWHIHVMGIEIGCCCAAPPPPPPPLPPPPETQAGGGTLKVPGWYWASSYPVSTRQQEWLGQLNWVWTLGQWDQFGRWNGHREWLSVERQRLTNRYIMTLYCVCHQTGKPMARNRPR